MERHNDDMDALTPSLMKSDMKRISTNKKFDRDKYPTTPICVTCSNCNKHVKTQVVNHPGCGTYCITGVTCCICCPLFFVPCMMKRTQDATHYCPKCSAVIGERKMI